MVVVKGWMGRLKVLGGLYRPGDPLVAGYLYLSRMGTAAAAGVGCQHKPNPLPIAQGVQPLRGEGV